MFNGFNRPLVIGHRGNSGEAPMNTLIAIEEAIQLGADMVEVDVNLTADGVPILIHDHIVDETTNGTGSVFSYTFEEIKKLDAGSWKGAKYAGEKVPSLMEALDLGKGRIGFSLDLKTERAIPALIRAVTEARMRDEVVICGCYVSTARMIKEIDPDLTVLLNLHPDVEKLARNGRMEEFISTYISQARMAGLPALNLNHRYLTPQLLRRAHMQALSVWAFTVDDESTMRKLIEMGVDAIYTNYPRRLIDLLSSTHYSLYRANKPNNPINSNT